MRTIVCICIAIAACESRDSRSPAIDDIQRSPLYYLGRTVTVSGRVDKVYEDRAFELQGDGILWPDKLLVVTRTPVQFGPTKLAEHEELAVSGTVQRMAPGELDRELGRPVDPTLADRYRDRPIVVADSVRLIETNALWSKRYQQGAIVSVIRLLSAADPTMFAGHAVDLVNVPVRATADGGLWIGFGPQSELFLVPALTADITGIAAGDHIAIRGTVREVPPAGLAPARGEKVYIEASEVTKLARPAS